MQRVLERNARKHTRSHAGFDARFVWQRRATCDINIVHSRVPGTATTAFSTSFPGLVLPAEDVCYGTTSCHKTIPSPHQETPPFGALLALPAAAAAAAHLNPTLTV